MENNTITVTVTILSNGRKLEVETPQMILSQFLKELVAEMALPTAGAYSVINVSKGDKPLDNDKTLEENGVFSGDELAVVY